MAVLLAGMNYTTMRTLLIIIMFFSSVSLYSQTVRSYIESEIGSQSAQGVISEVLQHCGTWVEWSASGDEITMMDGTRWILKPSNDGLIHYKYAGTSGQSQPYTQLIETVFNNNYSKMRIRYDFGPMGMTVPIIGLFRYIGDGKELAEEWINMSDEE